MKEKSDKLDASKEKKAAAEDKKAAIKAKKDASKAKKDAKQEQQRQKDELKLAQAVPTAASTQAKRKQPAAEKPAGASKRTKVKKGKG